MCVWMRLCACVYVYVCTYVYSSTAVHVRTLNSYEYTWLYMWSSRHRRLMSQGDQVFKAKEAVPWIQYSLSYHPECFFSTRQWFSSLNSSSSSSMLRKTKKWKMLPSHNAARKIVGNYRFDSLRHFLLDFFFSSFHESIMHIISCVCAIRMQWYMFTECWSWPLSGWIFSSFLFS